MSSNDAKGASRGILSINTTAGVTDAWLKMQESTLMMNRAMMPDLNKLFPDTSKLLTPAFADAIQSAANMAAMTFPKGHLTDMQRIVGQTSGVEAAVKQINDNHAAISKMLDLSYATPKMLGFDDQFQKSITAATSSLVSTIDTSGLQGILATASAFRDELGEQDLDELTDEFFENHPDLAASLEQSPALYALSKSDRRFIVWFVGIIVTLYVGNALLHIGTDYPEVKAMIDAFGLDAGGGLPAGWAAAKLMDKALDKLPQEED